MRALLVAAALVSGCSVHTATTVGTAGTAGVDRSIDAPPFGPVTLGVAFSDSARANRLADTLYQLTPDPTAGIATLTLHLTPDRRIAVIDVAYAPTRRFADEVANARGRLGNPSATRTENDGTQYTSWQDARTRFELVGRAFNNRSAVTGRLTDLLLGRP